MAAVTAADEPRSPAVEQSGGTVTETSEPPAEPVLGPADLDSLLPAEARGEFDRFVRGESARVAAVFRGGDVIVAAGDLLVTLAADSREVRGVVRIGADAPLELLPLPGSNALLGGRGDEYRVYNLSPHPRSGAAASRRVAEVKRCRSAALAPDGSLLAAWAGERIELWDVATGTRRHTLDVGSGGVRCLGFAGSDRVVAVQADAIRFWDAKSGQPEPFVSRWGDASLYPVRLVQDGEFLVAQAADKIVLLHTRSGAKEWTLRLPGPDQVNLGSGGATPTEDGTKVYVARGGSVQLWDRTEGAIITGWSVESRNGNAGSDVRDVSVSPSGELALARTYGYTTRLLDPSEEASGAAAPAVAAAEPAVDDRPLNVPAGLSETAAAEWLRLEKASRAAEYRNDRAADGGYVLPDYPILIRCKLEQIALLRKELGERSPSVFGAVRNLALYYDDADRPEDAERCLRLAAELYDGLPGNANDRPHPPFDDLGERAEKKGNLAEAARWYERALAYERSDTLYGGKARPALARLYEAAGRLDDAEAMLVEALKDYEALSPTYVETEKTRELLAAYYARHRREKESIALDARQLASLTARLGPSHPDVGDGCLALAERMAGAGRPDLAAESAGHGFRIQRDYVASALPFLGERERSKFMTDRYRPAYQRALALAVRDPARPEAARAVEWVLNGKSVETRAFAAVRRLALAGSEGEPAAKGYVEARRRLAELASAAAPDPAATAEAAARADASAAEMAKRGWRSLEADRWVATDEVRAALRDDEVLVEFSLLPFDPPHGAARWPPVWGIGAWVVPPSGKGDVTFIPLGDAAEVSDAVRSAYQALGTAGQTDGRSKQAGDARSLIDRGLQALAGRVLRPLRPRIDGYRTWVFSPDHALWAVPWAALPVEADVFAVERHDIALVSSGRDLLSGRPREAAGPPLVVADPAFDSGLTDASGPKPFAPLPETADEARRVAKAVSARPGSAAPVVLTGDDATEAAVKRAASPELLLLSTHGYVDFAPSGVVTEPLAACGVGLAGANAAASGGGDGLLTGAEVLDMDLRGTRLVALSACQTGSGAVTTGEGVASLRQAFHIAGAESVVASLWPVPVAETADLMAYLFEADGPSGPAAALSTAQRRVIEVLRRKGDYADPRLWAAFDVTLTR